MIVWVGMIQHTIPRRSFRIGRDADCELVLNDSSALPVHAVVKIRRRGDEMVAVLDCNGPVFVDDQPYSNGDLRAGTSLRIGTTTLRIAEIPEPQGAWWNPRTWGGGEITHVQFTGNPPRPEPVPEPVPVPVPVPVIPPTTNNPPPPRGNPPPPPPRPPIKPFAIPSDAEEAALFGPLVKNPGDADTRMVYADWLEQKGDGERAAIVRGQSGPGGEPVWRALVSCNAIRNCNLAECPKQWDKLAMTTDARVRQCGHCGHEVFYVNDPATERFIGYPIRRHVRD